MHKNLLVLLAHLRHRRAQLLNLWRPQPAGLGQDDHRLDRRVSRRLAQARHQVLQRDAGLAKHLLQVIRRHLRHRSLQPKDGHDALGLLLDRLLARCRLGRLVAWSRRRAARRQHQRQAHAPENWRCAWSVPAVRKGELAVARAHNSVFLAAQRSNVSIFISVLQPLGLPVYLSLWDSRLLTNVYAPPLQEGTANILASLHLGVFALIPRRFRLYWGIR